MIRSDAAAKQTPSGVFARPELALASSGLAQSRLICAIVSVGLESTRLEWENAYRDFTEVSRNGALEERMRMQLDAVTTELRRRVGGTFTVRELADEYVRADGWAREALAEQATPGWPRTLALVEGAAFHLYARGAVDYEP